MTNHLITIILIFLSFLGLSQSTFQKNFIGNDNEMLWDIKVSSDGGFISTGFTHSFGSGGQDVYVIKFDVDGNKEWDKTYGGATDDRGYSITQTLDNGYVICGVATSFSGNGDIYVVKIDSLGNLEWENTYGGPDEEDSYKILQLADSSYMISGITRSYGSGIRDIYLIKIDNTGNLIFSKTYGGNFSDWCNDFILTSTNELIIAGKTMSYGSGSTDAYLIKLDINGNVIWSKVYGLASDDDFRSIIEISSGEYVIGGFTGSSGAGQGDAWLVKVDTTGSLIWSNIFGSSSQEVIYSIVTTEDNGFALLGESYSFYSTSNNNSLLIKTDSLGNQEWVNIYGGNSRSYGLSLKEINSGFILSGASFLSASNENISLIKTDTNGFTNCFDSLVSLIQNIYIPNITNGINVGSGGVKIPITSNHSSTTITEDILCYYAGCSVNPGSDQTICDGDTVTLSGSGATSYTWDNGVTDGVPFTPSTTTTYTVIGTTGSCTDTAQVTITVNPSSTNFDYGGSTAFCLTDTDPVANITGTPGGTFSSSAGLTIDPTTGTIDLSASTPGNYQVTYTPSSNYTQIGQDIEGEAATDYFGWSSSINSLGNRIAVGAYFNDGNGADAGHVRIFENNGSNWNQLGQDIDGEAAGDHSGFALSMNSLGDRVIVGARNNNGNGTQTGHVRIYEWNGTSWIQLGQDIDGESANDYSGYTVSMNSLGDIVAIGAPFNDGNGTDAGHVRIYEWNGSSWSQLGSDIDGEAVGDFFGQSVSINSVGDRVAIGGYANGGNGGGSGHTRIYSYIGSSWVQLGSDIDGENVGDKSGYSVAINDAGDRVVISSPFNDDNGNLSGHVRVFNWDGNAWNQLGANIPGEAAGDYSGLPGLDINGDGDIIAIGSVYNDGNGLDAGHFRVFYYNGNAWIQSGNDVDGEASIDHFGESVSMNTAGNIIVAGGPYNDGNGPEAGHVRVFGGGSINVCNLPLDITISDVSNITDTQVACDTYTWIDGNTYTTSNNTATWTLTNAAGCDSIITLDLTINTSPTISSGGDQTICDGDTVTLSGSGGTSYTWDNGITDGVPFTVSATTTYTVTGTDANGCTNTDYATIIVNPNPSVDAGNDQTICEGTPITLSGAGATSYTWDNGVTDGVQFNPTVTTTYTVIGTDANGCTATDSITITVGSSLNVIAGADTSLCEGESITLSATGAVNYSWDNGVINGVSFTPSNTATYIVIGTDNNNCEGTDTITVAVNTNPALSGTSTNVSQGSDGSIDVDVVNGTPPYVYDWDIDGLGDFDDNEDISNLDAGTYMLIVMDDEGCKDTLILIITEDTDLTINPLLTPNGDGINDVWNIDGLSNYPQCKVNVLNRWGQVLFNSLGYASPWDGTFNGTPLPASDYFYIIDLGNGGPVYKGTLTIKY